MRIAFVHYPGRIARLEAARSGQAPTEFLFGSIELERRGLAVEHFELDPQQAAPGWPRAIDELVGRGFLPPHLSASGLAQTRRLLSPLACFDVVVATTMGTSMPLAVWKRAGLLRPPLVGIVSGLADPAHGRLRRRLGAWLLGAMQAVLYGEAEAGRLRDLGRSLRSRVHVNQFGVDTRFWTPGEARPREYVLAIGNDGRRDYDTLLAAASTVRAPIRILTLREPPPRLPGNVSWEPADWYRQVLSDAEVRDLYRRALVVVVPLRDSLQPSGQSVTLQAMACGAPVVLTETKGLWSRATIRHGVNVWLVPPGDPVALARAIDGLLRSPSKAARLGAAGRKSVCSSATVEQYAQRLLDICRLAVSHASPGSS